MKRKYGRVHARSSNNNKLTSGGREQKGGKYKEEVLHFQADKMDPMGKLEVTGHVFGVFMIQQYSLKDNFVKYGEAAVTKELSQLHDMNTFTPVGGSYLSK